MGGKRPKAKKVKTMNRCIFSFSTFRGIWCSISCVLLGRLKKCASKSSTQGMEGEGIYPSAPVALRSGFILGCYLPWLLGCTGMNAEKFLSGVSSHKTRKSQSRRGPRQSIVKLNLWEAGWLFVTQSLLRQGLGWKVERVFEITWVSNTVTNLLMFPHGLTSWKTCVYMLPLLLFFLFTMNSTGNRLCPSFLLQTLFIKVINDLRVAKFSGPFSVLFHSVPQHHSTQLATTFFSKHSFLLPLMTSRIFLPDSVFQCPFPALTFLTLYVLGILPWVLFSSHYTLSLLVNSWVLMDLKMFSVFHTPTFIYQILTALSTLDPYNQLCTTTQEYLQVWNGTPDLFLKMWSSASLSHSVNDTNIYLIAQARNLGVILDFAFLSSSYLM